MMHYLLYVRSVYVGEKRFHLLVWEASQAPKAKA